VQSLFPGLAPASFGPNGLEPADQEKTLARVASARLSGLRVRVRQECPRRPGVYGMVTERGELVYVGKAKCLRSRLLSYFRPRSRDPKAGRIIKSARAIVWEPAPSEFGSLARTGADSALAAAA
jgi:excinuclease ABC subunit C